MTFLTAGYIDGSRVKAEVLRRDLWASTGGATGVIRPADLKVLQTGTASTSIVISAGSAVIESTFANAGGNSYLVTNDQALTVAAPAAAGTYLVMLAVRDPQYAGQVAPPDPLTNSYTDVLIQATAPVSQPYITLASIVVSSAGAVVTTANITDKRALARPRTDSDNAMLFPASDTNMSKTAYVSWPLSPFSVTVPTWATELALKVTVNGVESAGAGATLGGLRVTYHNSVAQNGIIQFDGPGRQTVVVIGKFDIPSGDRGQLRYLGLQGYQTAGTAVIQQDYQSQVVYEWTFSERLA